MRTIYKGSMVRGNAGPVAIRVIVVLSLSCVVYSYFEDLGGPLMGVSRLSDNSRVSSLTMWGKYNGPTWVKHILIPDQ